MALTLNQMVIKFLKNNPNKKVTSWGLAEKLVEFFPVEFAKKRKNPKFKTQKDFISQIQAEIGSRRKNLLKFEPKIFVDDHVRPRLYYYSEKKPDEEEIIPGESETEKEARQSGLLKEYKEHDLYPILSIFLGNELNIFSKRINEKKSKNTKGQFGNQWLHPDMVGIEIMDDEWKGIVSDCVKGSGGNRIKITSYEVKKKLTRSNIRQSFFQAVSNSSWANRGYLVATEICDSHSQVWKELQMLSTLHGIGFILLNPDNPTESQILLPPRERKEVDWESVNRIVIENEDFYHFIQSVKVYYESGILNKNEWAKFK
ncbi:COG2958 family protein [Candidatus Riflebacteria bacterium]